MIEEFKSRPDSDIRVTVETVDGTLYRDKHILPDYLGGEDQTVGFWNGTGSVVIIPLHQIKRIAVYIKEDGK